MMIDWIAVRLPLKHTTPIRGNLLLEGDPVSGEILWEHHRRHQLVGSHDQTISVRTVESAARYSDGDYAFVDMEGNPAKFLQGHNLFGPLDTQALVCGVYRQLLTKLGIVARFADRNMVEQGVYDVRCVDITAMFSTGSRSNARAWVNAAATSSRLTGRANGGGILTNSTLYWGKHSRRSALKAYVKGDELEAKDHGLPESLPLREQLLAWADDKLRIEARFRQLELKRLGLSLGAAWSDTVALAKFQSMVGKLSLNDATMIADETLEQLPRALRAAYLCWQGGADMQALYSRRTFYRYRAQLLKHGVDISVKQGPDRTNVVPLIRYIEAVPATAPAWAEGTPLLYAGGRVV